MWSRHSRRTLPRNRSHRAFALGARNGVRRIFVPAAFATASNALPNLSSLSRMRNRGPCPHGVAFLSCCAVQTCEGDRVPETWTTLREPSSMMRKAKIGRNRMS